MKDKLAARNGEWILNIIKSCQTLDQLKNCWNMVENFRIKYKTFTGIIDELEQAIIDKQAVIYTFY